MTEKIKVKKLIEKFSPFEKYDIRDDIHQGKFSKVEGKKYLYIDPETNNIYDVRNKLNNLSGKEWTHFLSSIMITNYPTKGKDSYAWDIRRVHPSPKPPLLMKEIIEFFSKEGEWVLDPFMGVGGTLLGASLARRNAVGIEINESYIQIYRQVCKKLDIKEQIAINGNSFFLEDYLEGLENFFSVIVTDPPYWNMQSKVKTGEARKKKKNLLTPFSYDEYDLGNIDDYSMFLDSLSKILSEAVKYLRKRGHLIVFIKDMQPKGTNVYMIHADLTKKLLAVSKDLRFLGYKIWFDQKQNLYPFGYPFVFVSNIFHQYILIFRKE